jgi:hypothetical protein
MHDNKIARLSNLDYRLSTFCRFPGFPHPEFYIYGDPAYGRTRYIQKPYPRLSANGAQQRHNTTMSSVRVSVENQIGEVTNTFPGLDFTRSQKLGNRTACSMYLAAVILRNLLTCVRGYNQVSQYFDLTPPTVAEFLRARDEAPPRLVELQTRLAGP